MKKNKNSSLPPMSYYEVKRLSKVIALFNTANKMVPPSVLEEYDFYSAKYNVWVKEQSMKKMQKYIRTLSGKDKEIALEEFRKLYGS